MGALAKTWNVLWFPTGAPHALAVFRVLFAAYVGISWATWFPFVELHFSSAGFHLPKYHPPEGGLGGLGGLGGVNGIEAFIGWLTGGASPAVAWTLYWGTAIALLCMFLGLFTRASVVLVFASMVYHYYLDHHMMATSYHRLALVLMAMMTVAPCGRALSLDALRARREGRHDDDPVSLFAQRLIRAQIALIYLGPGVHKIIDPSWESGEVLRTALIGDYGSDLGFWLAAQPFMTASVYQGLVYATIIWELWMPVALFVPRLLPFAFAVGMAFHLFNATFLQVPQFLLVALSYPLFLEPERVRLWVGRAVAWFKSGPGDAAAGPPSASKTD